MRDGASRATRRRAAQAIGLPIVGLAFFLAGCAQAPRETFDLSSEPVALRSVGLRSGSVVFVAQPVASFPTASDRVVVRAENDSIAVLPGVQWSAPLPGLLQARLVEAMQRSGLSASENIGGPTRLQTDLRRFEIDIGRNLAVVEIAAQLVDDRSGRVRAARLFVAEAPAPDHTGAPAVRALSEAAAQAAARLAQWARAQL